MANFKQDGTYGRNPSKQSCLKTKTPGISRITRISNSEITRGSAAALKVANLANSWTNPRSEKDVTSPSLSLLEQRLEEAIKDGTLRAAIIIIHYFGS